MKALGWIAGLALLAAGVWLQLTARGGRPPAPLAPDPPPAASAPAPGPPAASPAAGTAPAGSTAAVGVLRDALRGAGAADWPALLAGLASLSGPEARPAVPLLVELASRPGGAEALPAVLRALERIGGPEAARALHALGRERPEAAEDAAARLSRIEDRDAAPALLEVLEAEGGRGPFAAGAARALGRTRLRAHVQRLAALAAGAADLRVREAAVEALGEVADPEALPALERLLEDPEARVRRPAIRALGRIRAPRSFAALEALLAREPPPLEESIAKEALARLRGEDPRLVR